MVLPPNTHMDIPWIHIYGYIYIYIYIWIGFLQLRVSYGFVGFFLGLLPYTLGFWFTQVLPSNALDNASTWTTWSGFCLGAWNRLLLGLLGSLPAWVPACPTYQGSGFSGFLTAARSSLPLFSGWVPYIWVGFWVPAMGWNLGLLDWVLEF